MKSRVDISALKGVPETLLIPLVGRALAAERFPELGFRDEWAEEIVRGLDFDPKRFSRDFLSMRGVAERAKCFDDLARTFSAAKPGAMGASLGAGLCTRFHRIDDGKLRWTDLDLPEVIAIKRKVIEEGPRYRMVAASLLDDLWPEQLGWSPGTPLMLMSEGVLIYFDEAQVRAVLRRAVEHFTTGADLVFDYVHPLFRALSGFNLSVRKTGSRFHFGMRNPKSLLDISPRLQLLEAGGFMHTGLAGVVDENVKRLRGVNLYGYAHYRITPV